MAVRSPHQVRVEAERELWHLQHTLLSSIRDRHGVRKCEDGSPTQKDPRAVDERTAHTCAVLLPPSPRCNPPPPRKRDSETLLRLRLLAGRPALVLPSSLRLRLPLPLRLRLLLVWQLLLRLRFVLHPVTR